MKSTYAIKVGDITVELVAQSDVIVQTLRKGEGFEGTTLLRWVDICSRGGTVLDIGAYSGLFSIIAAKLGCDVIAFEPMPTHVERCKENFDINSVKVDIRHVCITNKVGPSRILYNPRVPFLTSGASLIRPSGGNGSRAESQPLPVDGITIDSLELPQCTAIKIDVERGEPLVLAGAKETLARCKPSMIVEVLGQMEKEDVQKAVIGYYVAEEMDIRNWLMLPE